MILDTGCPVPLILSGAAARDLGIDVDALPDLGEMMRTTRGARQLRREDEHVPFYGVD